MPRNMDVFSFVVSVVSVVTWNRGQGASMVQRQKGDDRKPWQSKADHLMVAEKQRKTPGEASGV